MKRHPSARAIETLLSRLGGGGSPAVKRLAARALALDLMASNRDPTETPEAHTLCMSRAASKLSPAIAEARTDATAALNAAADRLRHAVREATGLNGDVHRGAEIRAHRKGLKNAERLELIQRAMAARDSETLSAVFMAPAYLCGLSDEIQARFREDFERTSAPDAFAAFTDFQAVDAVHLTLVKTAEGFIGELLNPAGVARIVADQQAASAAQAAFDGA